MAENRARARGTETLPLISVIVPVRNDAHRLQRCLWSIKASSYPADRVEILVADNGSTDASPQVAVAMGAELLHFPDIRVSEVRNQAGRLARGEILAFVDADHELDSQWIPCAVETLQASPAAAVGAAYHAPPDGTWVQRLYDSFRLRIPGHYGWWHRVRSCVLRCSICAVFLGDVE